MAIIYGRHRTNIKVGIVQCSSKLAFDSMVKCSFFELKEERIKWVMF